MNSTAMPFHIHFEDEHLIILEKPAGLACVSHKKGMKRSVEAELQNKYPTAKCAHRLDNGTSGLLIAAKNPKTFELLRAMFSAWQVHKEYLAIVLGHPDDAAEINTPIAHHPQKKNKMLACETAEKSAQLKARNAQTFYKLEQQLANYALLRINITTGVRHQIRVHLASLGLPLVGDKLYQTKKRQTEDKLGLKHHCLHACFLSFIHPITKEEISAESALPEYLAELFAT